MKNLFKRTISALVFGVILLFTFLSDLLLGMWLSPEVVQLCGKLIYGVVFLFAMVVMMKEFLKMTCAGEYRGLQFLSILAGAVFFILVFLYKGFDFPGWIVLIAFIPLYILMVSSLYLKDKSHFDKFANLYTAVLYIAVPWSLLNFAAFTGGKFNGMLLMCFFCIIWGSDVGAYLFGMSLGQRFGKKLFPSISPKKSWIGFWGGLLVAVGVAVTLHYTGVFDLCGVELNLVHSIVLAVLLDVTGVYGDLIESQWKRHYDVKDSGNIIPGHGGLLDRFDSALVAIPVGIIYLLVLEKLCL